MCLEMLAYQKYGGRAYQPGIHVHVYRVEARIANNDSTNFELGKLTSFFQNNAFSMVWEAPEKRLAFHLVPK